MKSLFLALLLGVSACSKEHAKRFEVLYSNSSGPGMSMLFDHETGDVLAVDGRGVFNRGHFGDSGNTGQKQTYDYK